MEVSISFFDPFPWLGLPLNRRVKMELRTDYDLLNDSSLLQRRTEVEERNPHLNKPENICQALITRHLEILQKSTGWT